MIRLARTVGKLLKGSITVHLVGWAFGKEIPLVVVRESLTIIQFADDENTRDQIVTWVLIAKRNRLVQKEIISLISRLIWDGRDVQPIPHLHFENSVPVPPPRQHGLIYASH